MQKHVTMAALCAALIATPAMAEQLEPRMSAQDVRAATEVEESHIIVPIMMMVALVLTAGK